MDTDYLVDGYELFREGFRLVGCTGIPVASPRPLYFPVDPGLPPESVPHYQHALQVAGTSTFTLPFLRPGATGVTYEPALRATPTRFRLVFRRTLDPSDPAFGARWPSEPFFYQDERRTFLVTRKVEPAVRRPRWTKVDGVSLDARAAVDRSWMAPTDVDLLGPSASVSSATSPAVAVESAAPVPGGSASARLLRGLGALSPSAAGLPRVAPDPSAARADVHYVVGGATGTVTFSAGSDGDRTTTISREIAVPAPSLVAPSDLIAPVKTPTVDRYLFEGFYHPYVCTLLRQLQRYGVDGLLNPLPDGETPDLRRQSLADTTFFDSEYDPTDLVALPYPADAFDFAPDGAYSQYNWELFFHVPILIADRLVKDQQYEKAFRWFHTVFNPTERAVPSEAWPDRVWKIKPFFEAGVPDSVEDLLSTLTYAGDDPARLAARHAVERQIAESRAKPFAPHRIARIRSGAYQRYVVMRYIEALIGWGDMLFRRETLEALNEAAYVYMLALRILGRRPNKVERTPAASTTFAALVAGAADGFTEALVKAEALLPSSEIEPLDVPDDAPTAGLSFSFCLPPNPRLLGLWDIVEDRLFKLRHCMTIEGVVRQLPLFEPPIDPALLVSATAAGVDLSTVLSDLHQPAPIRRFRVLLQKAMDLVNEVKALGAALLAALEKRDAEALSQLRARQERDVVDSMRETRKQQVAEARESLSGLERQRAVVQARRDHYANLKRELPEEAEQQAAVQEAGLLQIGGQIMSATGSFFSLIPQFHAQTTGAGTEAGGQQIHNYYQGWASVYAALSASKQIDASSAGYRALQQRRAEDWRLQVDLATRELAQLDKAIAAQRIRVAVAEHEVETHAIQLANAVETQEFLQTKYTNEELYDWMVGELASIYFQSYQLAFETARRAERAFRFERYEPTRSFVRYGAWENLRKGLLSGERLALDLRRMELAFLQEDRRELELVRHLSLAELAPEALVQLRQTGHCSVTIPERVFDEDTPGHYLRRVRSISLTLPSVTGPYTPVRCRLTMISSQVRRSTLLDGGGVPKDEELVRSDVPIVSIVTSHGRDDAGLFDTGGGDERYLPFEGAGVVCKLELDLPSAVRAFDYDTLQDVVFHFKYTARDGGAVFRAAVVADVEAQLAAETAPRLLLVSARHDAPDEWHRFLHPTDGAREARLELPLTRERLPFGLEGKALVIRKVEVVAVVTDPTEYSTGDPLHLTLTPPGGDPLVPLSLTTSASAFGGLPRCSRALDEVGDGAPLGTLAVSVPQATLDTLDNPALLTGTAGGPRRLDPDFLKDVLVVVHYGVGSVPATIDYTIVTPGRPFGVGELPGEGVYEQAVGAGQIDETVVTDWATGAIARFAAVADAAKVGRAPNGLAGLRLQAAFKNYLRSSEDLASWTLTGSGVVTSNTSVAPDGTLSVDKLTDNDAAAYELARPASDAVPNDSAAYRLEIFVKKTTGQTHAAGFNWVINGGTVTSRSIRLDANDGTYTQSTGTVEPPALFGPGWWRWADIITNNSSGATAPAIDLYPASTTLPLPGSDTSAGTGAKEFWGAQLTRTRLRKEYQPTGSTGGASVESACARHPAAGFVKNGRLSIRLRFSPAGAASDYSSNFKLLALSDTTYVQFTASTGKLSIAVGGAVETLPVPLAWRGPTFGVDHVLVDLYVGTGGNAPTVCRYRLSFDGGSTWTQAFDPFGGAGGATRGNISSEGSLSLLTGTSAGEVGDGWLHGASHVAAVPAWVLEQLPTDLASIRAWLRWDGGTLLSGSAVSAWQDQSQNALDVAQASAASRPVFHASGGLDGAGYLEFDGNNDCLSWSAAISATAANYLMAAVVAPISTTGNVALFDTYDGTTDRIILTQSGYQTSGKASWYTDANAWTEPANSISGPQLMLWDLTTGAGNAKFYRNGVQVGTGGSYTQRKLGPGTGGSLLGAIFNQTANYFFYGRIYDFVVLRNHSAPDVEALHAFFRRRYPSLGIA